ncbi:hypothetical protein CPB97_012187 [Podila verticillata]|nr:hypothetical protein CPB97_012187 [Podila verticillata]
MAGQAKQKNNTAVSTATKSTTSHSTTRRSTGKASESASQKQQQRPKIEEIEDEDEDDEDDDEGDEEDSDDSDESDSDMEDIADPEKWRIIKESGVLEKVRTNDRARSGRNRHTGTKEVERDYIFEGIFFSIPTTCLFVVMDILVHRQFGEDYGSGDIFHKIVKVFPAILIMVYFSNKSKNNKFTQAAMFVISTLCGCYFLHTMFRSPAMGIMLRAPGIITILVYCIVQLNLLPAVISLALCGLYYKFGNVKYSKH